ncbi:MAG: hypothetical protein J6D08_09815 [Lachnospiraceae bacterium]|nr:hypothetical protein [Lachnospiraceae bacterium]
MRNELVALITTVNKKNKRGFNEPVEHKSEEIFAEVRSAGIIEKYEAERASINISIIFRVDTDSYRAALFEGEKPDKVAYDGNVYTIYDVRNKGTYKKLEIVCKGDRI